MECNCDLGHAECCLRCVHALLHAALLVVLLVQIRDVVVTFHKHRLEFKLLHDYRNSGGQMPPPHDTMQFETLKRRLVSQHEAGVCEHGVCIGQHNMHA